MVICFCKFHKNNSSNITAHMYLYFTLWFLFRSISSNNSSGQTINRLCNDKELLMDCFFSLQRNPRFFKQSKYGTNRLTLLEDFNYNKDGYWLIIYNLLFNFLPSIIQFLLPKTSNSLIVLHLQLIKPHPLPTWLYF